MTAADINGDGLDDIVFTILTPGAYLNDTTDDDSDPIRILLNDGAGSYVDATTTIISGPLPVSTGTRQFIIEDFNGDGRPDIFMDNSGTEEICCPHPGDRNRLLLSGPDGKLRDMTAEKLPGLHVFSHGSSAADIDGDGDIDIWVNSAPHDHQAGNYLMLNDGTGGFTIVADLLASPIDTVGPNGRLPEALVNHAAQWSQFIDVDNDGDFDLYLGAVNFLQEQNKLRSLLLLNDGSGRFTDAGVDAIPPRTFGDLTQVENSSVLDLNGDGFDDLLLLESPLDQSGCTGLNIIKILVAVLISNRDGTFRDETFIRTPQVADCHESGFFDDFDVGDIDGDGAVDILLQTDPIELLLNNGFGFFSSLPTDFVDVDPAMRFTFVPADVDGDGDSDFIEDTSEFFEVMSLIKAINTAVSSPNFAPIAFDDSFELRAGRTLEVGLADGVLKNDIEPDRQNLTVELIGDPSNGTLTLNADGSFTYVADRGFRRGTDTFTYKLSDGSLTSNVATVAITLEPIAMPWLILLLDD